MPDEREKMPLISKSIYFLYFLFLFTEGINEGIFTNKLTNAIAVVLMLILVLYVLQTMQFSSDRFTVLFFLFMAVCFASILWAGNKDRVLEVCAVLLKMFIMYALLENFVIKEDDIDSLILTVCLSYAVYGIFFVYYCLSHYGFEFVVNAINTGVRIGGEFDHPNSIGFRMAIGTILCLWYTMNKGGRFLIVGVIAMLIGIISTGSRTAIAMCALGIILLILIGQERSGFIKTVLIICAVTAAVYFLISSGALEGIIERFESLFKSISSVGTGDSSSKSRILMTKYGWEQFKQTPLLGIGIGNSGTVAVKAGASYAEGYLHNNFIELLVSLGIVGTAVFYGFFFHPIYEIISCPQQRNAYTSLAVILILVLLLGQLGSVQYTKKYIYAYIMLIMQLSKSIPMPEDEGDGNEEPA